MHTDNPRDWYIAIRVQDKLFDNDSLESYK